MDKNVQGRQCTADDDIVKMAGNAIFNEILGSDLTGVNMVEVEFPDGVFQKADFFSGRIDKHNGYRRD